MTYSEIKSQTTGLDLPVFAVNENGENIIISAGMSDVGSFYRITASQSNNWVRVSTFYEDGTIDETYHR